MEGLGFGFIYCLGPSPGRGSAEQSSSPAEKKKTKRKTTSNEWARHMGGCQNYGPFLDPYYNTAPNIQGTQKGTIILTTTHILKTKDPLCQNLQERPRYLEGTAKQEA